MRETYGTPEQAQQLPSAYSTQSMPLSDVNVEITDSYVVASDSSDKPFTHVPYDETRSEFESAQPPEASVGGNSDKPPTDRPPENVPAANEPPERPITDPALAELLVQNAALLGSEKLDHLLAHHARFDRPSSFRDELGNFSEDRHRRNREFLEHVPGFMAAAEQAAVPQEQAQELLEHTLDNVQNPKLNIQGSARITALLAKTFAASGENSLTEQNLAQLKTLISTVSEDNVIPHTLETLEAAQKAGLSLEDSMQLVDGYFQTSNGRQVYEHMDSFREALRTLHVAGVDPQLVKDVFQTFDQIDPQYRHEVYDDLRALITNGARVYDMKPEAVLRAALHEVNDETDIEHALGKVVERQQKGTRVEGSEPGISTPRERIDNHFIQKGGQLEHAAVPYQTNRSLEEGLSDIKELTGAERYFGDVVAEGHWIFDPHTDTWYSFGGETKRDPVTRTTSHTSQKFDVSELSDTPYDFHIHPTDNEKIADRYGHIFPSNADFKTAATMLDDAGNTVSLRSFISHRYGITEFTYPADTNALREAGEHFETLRDAYFEQCIGDEYDVLATARHMGDPEFIRAIVADINSHLPETFAIKIHPHGTNLGEIVRPELEAPPDRQDP
jgi:hypothetical protein